MGKGGSWGWNKVKGRNTRLLALPELGCLSGLAVQSASANPQHVLHTTYQDFPSAVVSGGFAPFYILFP